MKKLISILQRAVRMPRLSRCQQASENETLDDDQIRLLAPREVNLNLFVQIQQFNAVLEENNDISFTKTNDDDDI